MSQSELGAYIRLLCYQWNRGSIPVQPDKLERIAGGPVTEDVISKFEVGEDGLRRNARMESERQRNAHFIESQRAKGKKSGESRRTTVEPRLNHGSVSVEPNGQPKVNPPVPVPVPIQYPHTPKPKPAPSSPDVEGFADFWSAYPKRVSKSQALKAWNKLKPSPELRVEILQAVDEAKRSDQWTKDGGKYIPNPASYLNGRRWEDEVEVLIFKPTRPPGQEWKDDPNDWRHQL